MHDKKIINNVQFWKEPLIEFAFRVYSQSSVEERCLELQNKYHANVNIILWACWLESEGIELSTDWLNDVLISVDTLSQLTLSRLREVRQAVKASAGFNRVQTTMINKHILNAELTAEKIFLQRLQDLTVRFIEAQQESLVQGEAQLTASYYLQFLKVPDADMDAESLMILSKKMDDISLAVT